VGQQPSVRLQVAAGVLRDLSEAAAAPGASFEVAAVVTQPVRPRGRGKKPVPSPVAAAAADLGFGAERVLSPASAKDVRSITETNRMQLFLFGMQSRTLRFYH
jgi:methionyl-tRNA formyltransferase